MKFLLRLFLGLIIVATCIALGYWAGCLLILLANLSFLKILELIVGLSLTIFAYNIGKNVLP